MSGAAMAALLGLAAAAWPQASSRVAGGVVSSREWRVHRGQQKEEEFTGEVRYRTGPNVVRCDWARYKHEPQTWQLRGHVAVDRKLESGDRVEVSGNRGFFDGRKRSGWLIADDQVSFSRTPADGSAPDLGKATRLEWQGREHASLVGLVHLWGPRLESWSDRADYSDETGELKLAGGRPVLWKFPGWDFDDDWSAALKADDVRAWRTQHRLVADGGVTGWLEFKDLKGIASGRAGR